MFKIKNIKTIEPMKQNVWFFENINRMKEKLPRITKKKNIEKIKIQMWKSDVKVETLLPTLQKLKGLWKNTMNNSMQTN